MATIKIPLNAAVGDRASCAWQPVHGIWWVQTRKPEYAKQLGRHPDGRLVAWGVAGGFLRTFEFAKSTRWMIRLLARYTQNETCANDQVSLAICPRTKRAARTTTSPQANKAEAPAPEIGSPSDQTN